jgi:D-alanyl-D-alanine dipeptidase
MQEPLYYGNTPTEPLPEHNKMRLYFSTTLSILLAAGPLSLTCNIHPQNTSRISEITSPGFGPEFEELSHLNGITLDIRYATINNFTRTNLYGDFKACYLHKIAAEKMRAAIRSLSLLKPGWRFRVFDCLRPRRVQKMLWASVAGTPQQPYVANPTKGSIHNYGFAIDLTLEDEKGAEADMGTPYDTFSPLSEPAREKEFLKSGELSRKQYENRLILRGVMERAGFIRLGNEWWHFDALLSEQVRQGYRIVD